MGAQDTGSLYRSPRGLRPQLGVGAVNRTPPGAAKNRMVLTGHPKSPLVISQPMQAVNPTTQTPQELQGKTRDSFLVNLKVTFFSVELKAAAQV